jgi:hypothetical protein
MSFAGVSFLQSTLRHLAASDNQRLPVVHDSLNINLKIFATKPSVATLRVLVLSERWHEVSSHCRKAA